MKVRFAGQVPKDPSYPDANEDSFSLDIENRRIALSDGASESFDSKTWSQLLAEKFVQNPALELKWLENAVSKYNLLFDQSEMSWSKQAAFSRGSFSTLLGIEHFTDHGTLDVLCIGDTIALLLDEGVLVDSFPYTYAEEFLQRPELFCTNIILNGFFSSSDFFSRHLKTWSITELTVPIVLCMTDALGEWALRNAQNGQSKWKVLSNIENLSDLEALVQSERQAKSMRIDDVTLVKLSFESE